MRRALVMLALGTVLLAALWFGHRQLLQAVAEAALERAKPALQTEGLRVDPRGRISLTSARWCDGDPCTDILAKGVSASLGWRALLHGQLHVSELDVADVQIQPAAETVATPLPTSLGTPVGVRIDRINVARLSLPSTSLADLRVQGLIGTEQGWTLKQAQAALLSEASRWNLSLSGAIAAQPPFHTDVSGRIEHHVIGQQAQPSGPAGKPHTGSLSPWQINLHAQGGLQYLDIKARSDALTTSSAPHNQPSPAPILAASTRVDGWQGKLLAPIALHAQGWPVMRWIDALTGSQHPNQQGGQPSQAPSQEPRAAPNARAAGAAAAQTAAQAATPPELLLSGHAQLMAPRADQAGWPLTLNLRNDTAGPVADQRIPLQTLDAKAVIRADGLTLLSARAQTDANSDANSDADAHVLVDGQIQWAKAQQPLTLDLHTQGRAIALAPWLSAPVPALRQARVDADLRWQGPLDALHLRGNTSLRDQRTLRATVDVQLLSPAAQGGQPTRELLIKQLVLSSAQPRQTAAAQTTPASSPSKVATNAATLAPTTAPSTTNNGLLPITGRLLLSAEQQIRFTLEATPQQFDLRPWLEQFGASAASLSQQHLDPIVTGSLQTEGHWRPHQRPHQGTSRAELHLQALRLDLQQTSGPMRKSGLASRVQGSLIWRPTPKAPLDGLVHLALSDSWLRVGPNQLTVDGQFGELHSEVSPAGPVRQGLNLTLNAQDLSTLPTGWLPMPLTGQLKAQAQILGTVRQPSLTLQLQAAEIQAPSQQLRIDQLASELRWAPQQNTAAIELRAARVSRARQELTRLQLQSTGSADRHQLRLTATDSQQQPVSTTLEGGFVAHDPQARQPAVDAATAAPHWQGQLTEARYGRPGQFKLSRAAPLRITPHGAQISDVQFQWWDAQGHLQLLQADTQRIAVVGRIDHVLAVSQTGSTGNQGSDSTQARQANTNYGYAAVLSRDTLNTNLQGDLRLNIGLDLTLPLLPEQRHQQRGAITVTRSAGDLRLVDPHIAMALRRFDLSLTLTPDALQAQGTIDSPPFGQMTMQGRMPFNLADLNAAGSEQALAQLLQTPIQASLKLDSQSLAWLPALTRGRVRAQGASSADVQIAGTLAKPIPTGSFSLTGLQLAHPDSNLQITDGQLQAQLGQGRITLAPSVLMIGDGKLLLEGSATLPWLNGAGSTPSPSGNANPNANPSSAPGASDARASTQLTLQAVKLRLPTAPEHRILVSGKGLLRAEGQKLKFDGQFIADVAEVLLRNDTTPTLSDDIVLRRRSKTVSTAGVPATAPAKTSNTGGWGLAALIDLDLGKAFKVQSTGGATKLKADLRGKLQLALNSPGSLSARGVVNIDNGQVDAYGQKLDIERGALTFTGPFDDPQLDVIARRMDLTEVRPGVSVTGFARAPNIKLVADGALSDSEKLSWLVLGTGLDETSPNAQAAAALQAAARALIGQSQAPGLADQLGKTFGLDAVTLRSAPANTVGAVVSLSKRLTPNLFIAYEQSLRGVWNIVRLQYTLSRRWSIRAQAGTESSVDLQFALPFD